MKITFDMQNAERNFARAIDELARLPGFDRKKAVLGEAGSILKACAARTKVAPLVKLTVGGQIRALKGLGLTGGRNITINAGLRGPAGRVYIKKKDGHGYRRTHNDNFAPLNQHYTNEQWADLSAAVADSQRVIALVVAQAKQSAGLARQSWILIADSLGIDLASVKGRGLSGADLSAARAARAKGGRVYANGLSKIEQNQGRFFVTLINRLPYGTRIGLDSMLQSVIAGRVSYINQTFSKGVFNSMAEIAKKFPNWKVT